MKNLLVSIIFPVYNGGKNPRQCLYSLTQLTLSTTQFEVIIIDNHSTDKGLKGISRLLPNLQIIRLSQNYGFAYAVNIGAMHANGKYLFITNDDVRFKKDSLAKLITQMEKDIQIGVAGGIIFSRKNPHKIISCGYYINKLTGHVQPSFICNSIAEPQWVAGSALLTRNKLFAESGGFDYKYVHFFEDADYCFQVKKRGHRVITVPQAHFFHDDSTTANKNKHYKYQKWYRAKFRFIINNLPFVSILAIVVFHLLVIIPFRLFTFVDGRFTALVKGLRWNLSSLIRNSFN